MRHKTKAALDNILDTMTGSDGCIKILFYKNFIKAMDKRAKEGDNNTRDCKRRKYRSKRSKGKRERA